MSADCCRQPTLRDPRLRLNLLGTHVEFEAFEGSPVSLRESLELLDVDGVVVLHRGKIVWEAYDHGFGPGHAAHLLLG
jgi:hypothetical protein